MSEYKTIWAWQAPTETWKSEEKGFFNLCRELEKEGLIAFYYRKDDEKSHHRIPDWIEFETPLSFRKTAIVNAMHRSRVVEWYEFTEVWDSYSDRIVPVLRITPEMPVEWEWHK